MRKIQKIGKVVEKRAVKTIYHPSAPEYDLGVFAKGDSLDDIFNMWTCINLKSCGSLYTQHSKKVVKATLKHLMKKYSSNEIKRAIIACGLVAHHPFSFKFVRETLEKWTST